MFGNVLNAIHLQNLLRVVVHGRIIEIEALKVLKGCTDHTLRHAWFETAAKFTHMKFVVFQQNSFFFWC